MRRSLIIALSALAALPAGAGEICGVLNATERALVAGREPGPPPAAEDCQLARALGGAREFVCHWSHPLGGGRAQFENLANEIALCPDLTEAPRDQAVNHPDFYAQRRFIRPGAEIAVSLKDKAQLGQSFVFLKLTAPLPGG
ncbi:MAG: hypothetical protein AAGI70_13120 [Pseudomonadota bacterium]